MGIERTLTLHVGHHKTGTSTIQAFLYANRTKLARMGLDFPTRGIYYRPPGMVENLSGGHRFFAFAVTGTTPVWLDGGVRIPGGESSIRALRQHLASHAGDVLLSSEHFFTKIAPDELRGFFDGLGFRIRILLYLRRQDLLLESLFNQNVKNGYVTVPFSRFVEREIEDRQGYGYTYRRVSALARAFGPENLIIRPFEKSRFSGGTLLEDFVAALGLPWDEGFHIPANWNESIPVEIIEVLVRFQRYLDGLDEKPRWRFCELVQRQCRPLCAGTDSYRLFTPDEAMATMNHFEDNNRRIAREFMPGSRGCLFTEPVYDPGRPWRTYPGPDAEFLVRCAVAIWKAGYDAGQCAAPSLRK
uniref:Uncharacterized protein n=1 Tax=Candidatus Kentrum sp. FW TaxID=2126338 RepID=A0A450TP53_9GAMM|nr:MAG: hypothetical protein BECKFW1821C_GA0114237_101935 [Candidatus Kentron sp. FW]